MTSDEAAAGQAVVARRAALAAREHGTLPDCVCGCLWRRHLGRAGVGACECGCQGYRDTTEPEAPRDDLLWTSAERRRAAHERTRAAYMDELTHGRKED